MTDLTARELLRMCIAKWTVMLTPGRKEEFISDLSELTQAYKDEGREAGQNNERSRYLNRDHDMGQ